ncbi:ABC transporter permease [Sutcliffiella horikoshii]|uniref:ABC transporter permease n=1 Tax=Sutcliffiella horikoshii TaxID=79883 RepID=UPI003CF19207
MSLSSLIKTSLTNLNSHKLRTILTMLGIIIGISSVVTILSIGHGLKLEVLKTTEGTTANKINIYFTPDNTFADLDLLEPFNNSDINNLKKLDGVQNVEPSNESFGGLSFAMESISYFDKNTMSILDTFDKDKQLSIENGVNFSEYESNKNVIVLDKRTATELFGNPKEAIGRGVQLGGGNFEVIGTLVEQDAFSIGSGYSYISKESQVTMMKEQSIQSLDVFFLPDADKEIIFEDVKKELNNSHPEIQGEYVLQDPADITKAFEKIINGLTSFIAAVTAISLFVGGIGVMNIMYVTVTERKREIGIRRAIGARQRTILFQFLFEAIIVTGIAGLIGILCGYGFAKIAGTLLPFTPVLSVGSFAGATFTSITVGIIFGIVPAMKAAKLDPIEAIYH